MTIPLCLDYSQIAIVGMIEICELSFLERR